MLRNQYGVATSSSTVSVSHAEDAQPNETIYKRRYGQPPQINSTQWKSNYRDSGSQRGGRYSGQWTQYGMRGNSSQRGRGNFKSNRGGYNSDQRHTGQVQRSTDYSVPPIATLPDIEYCLPSSSNSSSSQIKPSHQPAVIRDKRSSQAELHYKTPPDVQTFSPSTSAERQLDPLHDYRWLLRSRSPSPKLPESALKRRKIECQPTHISNSGRNEDSVASKSDKHRSVTAEPMPPKTSKPLLPGRHRRSEGSPVHALHSSGPPVQVQSEAISPIVPNILPQTSMIKQEPRTPSPTHSLRMERSLITSSCKFYPIPEFCKKSYSGFKDNRKEFHREKMQELTRLGLTKIRSFFRDDGLAIEWKSRVPVWSDTLLPEFRDLASAIKRAHQINHQTSSPKRKRRSVEKHSRESSLKNNNNVNMELNGSKRSKHSLEKEDWADEIEMNDSPPLSVRNSSSPTPRSSLDQGNSSTTVVPLPNTSKLISFVAEVVADNQSDVLADTKPLNTSAIQQENTSAMDVDTSMPTQPPKPARRMLFKPVLPHRRNQPTTSSIQDSPPPTSDSLEPLSSSLSVANGHSKKNVMEVITRPQEEALQVKTSSPRPRLPIYSHPLSIPKTSIPGIAKGYTPTPPSLPPTRYQDAQVVEEVETQETTVSPSKDEDYGNTADPDAELVVDLLLHGTPEESHDRLSTPIQEDLPLHTGHKHEADKEDNDDEDAAAVEELATRFLQGYLQLFDVDRLKLETAYAKNALFSCRVHHVQEPSFSMAGLFAPESSRNRQGFNVSLSRGSMSAIQNGRAEIVNRLLELGPHRFCPRGVPRTVDYNVVPLSSTGGGILLTVHGEVVNPHLAGPQMDHVLSVNQSFVLRKRELEDENEEEGIDGFGQTISSTTASTLWPLVAVSHQMIVRDAAPLRSEQLDGLASDSRLVK